MAKSFFGPYALRFPDGSPAANVPVLVTNRNTNTPIELTRERPGFSQTIPNPTVADNQGNVAFFCEPGEYDLVVYGGRTKIHVAQEGGGLADDLDDIPDLSAIFDSVYFS